MKKLITILSIILLSLNVSADQLRYVTENQARQAVLYFKKFDIKQVVIWCSCCADSPAKKQVNVDSVTYREVLNAGRSYPEKTYELVITGKTDKGQTVEEGVDIAYVWVPFGEKSHTLAYELEIKADACVPDFEFPRWNLPDSNGVAPPVIFTYVEQMPEPSVNVPKFLGEHMAYPPKAERMNIQGKVIVKFVVDEEGNITNVEALTHLGGGLEQEAIRVVKLMPRWKPAMQEGKPVKVYFTLPIGFHLRN